MHISFRKNENIICFNSRTRDGWGHEQREEYPLDKYKENKCSISFEEQGCILKINNDIFKSNLLDGASFSDINFIQLYNIIRPPLWVSDSQLKRLWRFDQQKSGYFKSGRYRVYSSDSSQTLRNGLSAIIRAKNKEENIERCIRTIAPLVDEVIFVDNKSSDSTWSIANELQNSIFSLKTYSYPITIPRAGIEHCEHIINDSTNTLATYYNWCLSKVTRNNFMKWDADYIALTDNFREMTNHYGLRTRGDNICVWYSGLELYTDGARYWIDTESKHCEFRVFSKKHGAHWVDLPPWEEMEQTYFYKSCKNYYRKPVYLELFKLDEVEFKDRGIYMDDKRDRERYETVKAFKETGKIPKTFLEVSGPDDPSILNIPLSRCEIEMAEESDRHYRSVPKIMDHAGNCVQNLKIKPQNNICIIITCCDARIHRTEVQKETWIKDAYRAGIPVFIVVGRPNQPDCLVDDILYVDAPDEYEHLSKKIYRAIRYIYDNLSVDYLFKIDDDCMVNIPLLVLSNYDEFDYVGGMLVGGELTAPDWHFGKCDNHILNDRLFHTPEKLFWYGGQYGYFLSRKAMEKIALCPDEFNSEIYEDVAVAKALKKKGILANLNNKTQIINGFSFKQWKERNEKSTVVSDIPTNCEALSVYQYWNDHNFINEPIEMFRKKFSISPDWMDLNDVKQRIINSKLNDK